MNAKVGDRVVVRAAHVGETDRDGKILEVHGDNGGPPYLVQWSADGHTSIFVPGPDAHVEPAPGQ